MIYERSQGGVVHNDVISERTLATRVQRVEITRGRWSPTRLGWCVANKNKVYTVVIKPGFFIFIILSMMITNQLTGYDGGQLTTNLT